MSDFLKSLMKFTAEYTNMLSMFDGVIQQPT